MRIWSPFSLCEDRGANPFRNVGGTPSGVDPFFGLEGGGKLEKCPPQKKIGALRAQTRNIKLRAKRAAKMKIVYVWWYFYVTFNGFCSA